MPIPQRGTSLTLTWPWYGGGTRPIPSLTGFSSTISLDNTAYIDCINEAAEVVAASGVYRLILDATEQDGAIAVVQVAHGSYGVYTFVIDIASGIISGDAVAFSG